MSDFVLTPVAEGDLLKILEYLEGDNRSAILKVVDAQAIAEGLDFVTNDEPIHGYPVRTIW
jgi:hypothetical protein